MPFGVRPDSASTANTLTTTQARFSPYIEGFAAGDAHFRVRSDNTWSDEKSATFFRKSITNSAASRWRSNI